MHFACILQNRCTVYQINFPNSDYRAPKKNGNSWEQSEVDGNEGKI